RERERDWKKHFEFRTILIPASSIVILVTPATTINTVITCLREGESLFCLLIDSHRQKNDTTLSLLFWEWNQDFRGLGGSSSCHASSLFRYGCAPRSKTFH